MGIHDPLNDGKSLLRLEGYLGGDLDVVNDARESYEKRSELLTDRDIKLINYLLREKHYSPLRGTVLKFRVRAPLAICRQWWKHTVASTHTEEQLGWNEVSRRYTALADPDDFYVPETLLRQSLSNKQCSGEPLDPVENQRMLTLYRVACEDSYRRYKLLLDSGVSREQARMVLNPAFYTSWVWTASLQSVLNFCDLRLGSGAQTEIQRYAQVVYLEAQKVAPEVCKAWFSFRDHY